MIRTPNLDTTSLTSLPPLVELPLAIQGSLLSRAPLGLHGRLARCADREAQTSRPSFRAVGGRFIGWFREFGGGTCWSAAFGARFFWGEAWFDQEMNVRNYSNCLSTL